MVVSIEYLTRAAALRFSGVANLGFPVEPPQMLFEPRECVAWVETVFDARVFDIHSSSQRVWTGAKR